MVTWESFKNPGEDGQVCPRKVISSGNEYVRPTSQLCSIDIITDDEIKKDNEPDVHCEGGECL